MHVLDAQKSQLASLQDEHCRSVSTTPYSVARHTETRVPATSQCRCHCSGAYVGRADVAARVAAR
jgi:hypothetical protein